jgi:RNA polymerase sigma-70 factor (ECF subfamily)
VPDRETGDLSDADLLVRAAEGDRTAFHVFVVRHRASVWRYARLLCRSDADAEDVLQRTFIEAWRHAGQARSEGSSKGWLMTIARHSAYRMGRPRAGAPSTFASIDALGEAAGFADDAGPEERLAAAEERALLERALQRLSIEDREVLTLHELEGLSGREVAETTGLSLAAMKSRLHRARLRLMAEMREEVLRGG